MDLFLQFGYGMMEHSRSLVKAWGEGTTILSPRDLKDSQLRKLAEELRQLPGGRVVIDPQFYLPHAEHERLQSHAYWPPSYDTGVFRQGAELQRLIAELAALNRSAGATSFLLPGLFASAVTDDWLAIQDQIISEASTQAGDVPRVATIALGAGAVSSDQQIAELIEHSRNWDVNGYYVVAEHPKSRYLVDDPIWLANLMDLAASLRLQRVPVILGYCNQQMLIAGCAKVSAIASGTWMNVRSFPPEKFQASYDEEIRQRATWYYCATALSEYKIPFLDVAFRLGVLDQMRPGPELGSTHADGLFAGIQPTTVGFTEQAAFRHYLQCLRSQCREATRATFAESCDWHERQLDRAEATLRTLNQAGVYGQLREFREALDVNRAALSVFKSTRGLTLARAWSSL